ncbi:MAG: tol-pal system protein YbgF [Rhodocyclaceae bacterium]|nr:tol-pal system protein YbgF [Rhodocyclaceae bacterium]
MIRALLLAAALGLASLPVRAGLFDDEEARNRIDKLRTDFDELAKRADLAAKNQIDFANQAEVLKSDVAKLRGQIEVIVYELEATQKRQKDFYVDLDTRLRKLEAGPAEGRPEVNADAPKADPASEAHDYEAALTAFKNAKYKDSLAAFQSFIKNYPSSGLLPSAHYWAASSFYQLKDYGHAAELFGHLAGTWPNDAKAPDALLAEANARIEGGDAKGGRKALETLIEKYPASSATPSAKSRLKGLPPQKKK